MIYLNKRFKKCTIIKKLKNFYQVNIFLNIDKKNDLNQKEQM